MPTRAAGVVYIATSLDGYIARRDGGIDWLEVPDEQVDEEEDYGWSEFFPTIDHIVMGRSTFEVALELDPWEYYGDTPLTVLSTTLSEPPEHLRERVDISVEKPVPLLERLAERGVGRVYVDGGRTVQSFLEEDLIEEMTITRIPVLIGQGIPLFGPLDSDLAWTHQRSRIFDNGLVKSTYLRKR